jgi:hypothetical protein
LIDEGVGSFGIHRISPVQSAARLLP